MGTLDKIIFKQMEKAPRMLVRPILERKLKEAGVTISDTTLDAFADHLLKSKGEPFQWTDDAGSDELLHLKLTFTDDDSKELSEEFAKFTDGLPDIVLKTTQVAADGMYKRLRKNWAIDGAVQRYEADEFRDRLEERWGEGLDLLRMLLACCRALGMEADKRHRRSKSQRHACRRFVLTRLHVRACQVTDEIITLLENGFADGAMARWRTLHELSVVASLIADGDEALAERYINHDKVDVKRQADDYQAVQVPMGYAPLTPRDLKGIDADYQAVIAKYGQPFASPHGWAAERLGKKKPTFNDLQEEAGRGGMTSVYKMASYNVHAGSRSMFHRLTTMGDEDVLLSGKSNAGLVEPGRNTAHSLLLISSFLEDGRASLDQGAKMKALLKLRDAVAPAFEKAERKLERDHKALLKARRKQP